MHFAKHVSGDETSDMHCQALVGRLGLRLDNEHADSPFRTGFTSL